ncbi:quinol:cytochrome c oxidoreductase membrane protein 2 [Candidatus Sulfotelmatomonas gaucii]|uniref:Quinol:cytochrome c oxidoreductase membrane protein 2 n=1 Tax=Candidatus Sulfuritelmatomonas gaucii TaxID=2043161 RepID=A0A2N9LCG1_9BACT|nr:quinol:cytochrome c oxidoreductase membrane protein 2 [Candidatus Sulfotelmatomonas gaucii]
MANDSHASSHAKTLPAELGAPAFVDGWRNRALMTGVVFSVIALILAFLGQSQDHLGWDHFLRAWTLGTVITWGFAVGGLTLLMVQYCSGGKWGLLLRRPLEAMSRTLPLVFVYWVVIAIFMKRLYLWANYTSVSATAAGLKAGLITEIEAHCLNFKRPMLNPFAFLWVGLLCFAIWGLYAWRLNALALQRDAQGPETTPYWIKKFENVSGLGIVIYSATMTAAAIYWVMSIDVTWFSTVYGLLFLVEQGFQVLALGIIVALSLAKAEPFKTILRQTEQHDLGKLTFAFVMLNIYLNFGQFLIIWSGNLPNEINWYLDRIRGGWGVIITLDFLFHWLVPFTMLLSRDLKRNKRRLILVCQIMIFAVALNQFWLIEPSFKDAARNLHLSWGILEYIAVPVAMTAFWIAYFCTRLKTRPLVQVNDPHLKEILEPEHAHA